MWRLWSDPVTLESLRKALFEKRPTWKVPKISLPSFWECVIQPSRKCVVKQTICRGSGVEIPVRAESENPGWKLKWTFYNKFYESCRTAQFSINFWSKQVFIQMMDEKLVSGNGIPIQMPFGKVVQNILSQLVWNWLWISSQGIGGNLWSRLDLNFPPKFKPSAQTWKSKF